MQYRLLFLYTPRYKYQMHNSTVIVHLKVKGPKRNYDIIQVNKDIREKVINEKVCTEIMDSTNI